ncbi:MAG: hypothetical protein LBR10_01270 [Prevotellaceae bacterium]|jgi:hypothetical protein|nr:hypothetical protein [Prevotellaceae bacterium]
MNKISIAFILSFITITVSAQEEKLPHLEMQYTAAMQPMYLFNSGIRLDFEKRIKRSPSWLQISPSVYWVPKDDEYNSYLMSGEELSGLFGIGLDLNYKYFFNPKESFYVAAGCTYTHYRINYRGDIWNSYTEYDLTYHTHEYGNAKQNINRAGLNTYIGYQIPTPYFLFDMYVGLGYRLSFRSDKFGERFDSSMISPGYRGVMFLTGVRFGCKFK